MSTLKEIFEKAQSTGNVEYTYFGGGVYIAPFEQTSLGFGDGDQPYIRLGYDPSPKFRSDDPTNTFNTALAASRDVERISRFLSDFPYGPLWLTKQTGLQLSNPDTSYKSVDGTSNILDKLGGPRFYNPLGTNTIAQIPAGVLGYHFTRHGTSPTNNTGYISLNKKINGEFESRLTTYKTKIQEGKTQLNKYTGGPDSTLGLGNTIINSYTDSFGLNTGVTNKELFNVGNDNFTPFSYEDIQKYSTELQNGGKAVSITAIKPIIDGLDQNDLSINQNLFTPETTTTILSVPGNSKIRDFRKYYNTTGADEYNINNVHNRIGVTTGKDAVGVANTVDSINILRITPSETFFKQSVNNTLIKPSDLYTKGYNTDSVNDKVNGYYGRDIIKFRIEVLNNNAPTYSGSINTDVLAFRAYLETMSDNFKPSWKEFNYLGRGEPFYVYEKFSRDIQFTFTMFAHSEQEMAILYTKLNYLMSSTTPDYNKNNQMRGNYVYITIGDYIYRQPGVISSLNISDHFTAPWEIALNEPDVDSDGNNITDSKHYEIPKYLKVQVGFKPIHDFLPRRMYGEAEKGKTLNHTATFVTPNHMLLKKKYNRYLPSEI
jgi:hypothetical protein